MLGWRATTGLSTNVEPQGTRKEVIWHSGDQSVILILDLEMVGLWH
jgi:hypothetical protein